VLVMQAQMLQIMQQTMVNMQAAQPKSINWLEFRSVFCTHHVPQ
jgi:hypothetical protein